MDTTKATKLGKTPMTDSTRALVGPKICLMGPGGTGKTTSLATAVEWAGRNGFEVAGLCVETGLEALLGYWTDRDLPIPPNFFWHQQATMPIGLAAMKSMAALVGRLPFKGVTEAIDPDRAATNPFFKILESMTNFTDDRTGKSLGPVDQFPANRIFFLDSLTELSNAAMKMVIGARPAASQSDYQVAQINVMNFLRLLTQGTQFPFIMTAHVDREIDQVKQSSTVTIKSVGRALVSEIPPLFSDVILAVREGSKFTWDTAAFGVDVKTRHLGYRSGITPDFGQIFDLWLKRRDAK